jgi:hypothetical protein
MPDGEPPEEVVADKGSDSNQVMVDLRERRGAVEAATCVWTIRVLIDGQDGHIRGDPMQRFTELKAGNAQNPRTPEHQSNVPMIRDEHVERVLWFASGSYSVAESLNIRIN